jgi:pilus assembly protein CpaB
MRKPGTIFLFAIILGALTSAIMYRNLRAQRDEIEQARHAMEHSTVDVLVAKESIPIGARINAAQVHTVRWPADITPDGSLADPQIAVGRVARTTIDKNQPVVESQLVSEGSGLLPLLITEGMRAMSVKVDDVTGVSGFITPNSRVDVLVSGSDGEDRGDQRSKLILQNVKVLATGKSIEQKDEKPVEVPTVTLLVSPADAEKLTLASRQDPVRLALRNYRDEDLVGTPGISRSALLGHEAAAPVVMPVKTIVHRPAPYAVEVFLGSKLFRQEFERDSAPADSHKQATTANREESTLPPA